MQNRDKKMIAHALSLASKSEFHRAQMGCVATYRRRVIAEANNSNKTHPLQGKYNVYRDDYHDNGTVIPKVHAEIACLSIVKSLMVKHDINPADITLYVARSCRNRESGLARPCKACMRAIKDMGIKKVFYTTDVGIAEEYIS